jgi:tetratricopeptide (TPR) repeat protein
MFSIQQRGRRLAISLILAAGIALGSSLSGADAAEPKKPNAPKSREERAAARAAQKAAPSQAISKKLKEVQELLAENKIAQARRVIDDLEKRRNLKASDQANIYQFAAYVRTQQDQNREAADYFQKAVDLKALAPSAQKGMILQLARVYGLIDRFENALETVNLWFEPIGYDPPQAQVAEAHFLKGMILNRLERYNDAIPEVEKALELATVTREAWLQLLVSLYFKTDNFPKLSETLEKLIANFPDKKTYWTTISQIYAQQDKMDRALATLQIANEHKLLDKDKEFLALSQHLINQDIPYQCGQVLTKAIEDKILSADAKNYGFLANCWLVAREQKRAMDPLEKGAEVAEDGSLYLRLAYLHLQRDRYEEAIPVLNKALAKSKPDERGAINLLLGVSHIGTKHLDEAERALKAAMADQKARPDAERYLNFLEQERQRMEPPAA